LARGLFGDDDALCRTSFALSGRAKPREVEVELLEIYADEAGETHFRRTTVEFEERDFAPPSLPVAVSQDSATTTSLFLIAPPGWDESFHPTPRKQLVVMLEGEVRMACTDGEVAYAKTGDVTLLNDVDSKGHQTVVQGDQPARMLLLGLAD
jgi:hypothetical protein